MVVWNEGHSRRNTTMHEKAQCQNGSGMPENMRNSVGLENKVFIFMGQIDESGNTEKRMFINEKLTSLAFIP